MKKVTFSQVVYRSIASGLVTQNSLFFSLRDAEYLDEGLITVVYRIKPKWLMTKYTGAMEHVTKWYSPRIQGNGRCDFLQWITPLGLAIIKGDEKLEKLLLKLGASRSRVAGFLFKVYSADELREIVNFRG